MNSKVKEVEQVQVPMHPIIRNPEAISDDEISDPEVKVPQMQQAAQVQVPQMQQAAQVIHPQVQKLRITQANPPILKFTTGLAIRMCAGCRNTITHDQKTYRYNMVFVKKGIVAFYNPKCNKMQMKEQNIHFHLNMVCLRKNDKTTEYRHLRTNDETFEQLTIEQMEVLQILGFSTLHNCKQTGNVRYIYFQMMNKNHMYIFLCFTHYMV